MELTQEKTVSVNVVIHYVHNVLVLKLTNVEVVFPALYLMKQLELALKVGMSKLIPLVKLLNKELLKLNLENLISQTINH